MSASLLGLAWQAKVGDSKTRKLVLMKLVDCCDDEGSNIYPALATVANHVGCSTQQVRREMKRFCEVGLLRKLRDGGKGKGSTARYEMDIDLLARLRRPEIWPALEAAALHDPQPGHGGDGEAGQASSQEQTTNKLMGHARSLGDMASPLHGVRVTFDALSLTPDVTQPLSLDPLIFEREKAGADAATPTKKGGAPEADQAESAEPTTTLAEFRKRWPTTSIDHNGLVEGAWSALPFGERKAALAGIDAYLAELKRFGRGKTPSGSTYLGQWKWRDVPALANARNGAAPVAVSPWTRDWWHVVLGRITAGTKVGFVVEQAGSNKGLTAAAGEIEAARGQLGELTGFLCDGPAIAAWRPWLAARGARIPTFTGDFRVFLPGPTPPRGQADDGDDDVRF